MNIATIISETNPLDREAIALANVQRMRDDLIAAREENAQLKADLHRERDKNSFLTEQFNRARNEAVRFRVLLVELATQMTGIGLQTVKAQEIVRTVHEIDDAPTPPTVAIERLENEYRNGLAECEN
jgi:hypothetical protein